VPFYLGKRDFSFSMGSEKGLDIPLSIKEKTALRKMKFRFDFEKTKP
jgi:hypothetical protein